MLAILLLTALLVIRTAPESLPGLALARWLVDWPARKLSRLTRGQVVFWLGLGLLIWTAFALLGHETMQVLGMAMPDTVALFATFDMSVLADALVAAALVAANVRVRVVVQRLRTGRGTLRRPAGLARRRRRRRPPAAPQADNDDGDGAAFAPAKAA